MLDEPTNGLDAEGIRWLRKLLRAHADLGGTVLLSSHLMSEISEIADDVAIIADGSSVYYGSLESLTNTHKDLETAYFSLISRDSGTC